MTLEADVSPPALTRYYYVNGQRVVQSRNGVFSWIHSDHLHSATVMTNAAGQEMRRLAYTAFGEEALNTGTGETPPYTYTGKELDSTGLMYYGARYYDPVLCRFITPDTVYDAGTQGLNRYSYALNNPIVYRDPTGHAILPPGGDTETAQRLLLLGPTGMLIDQMTRHAAEFYLQKANESYARSFTNSSVLLPHIPIEAVGYLALAGIAMAGDELVTLLASGVPSIGAVLDDSREQIAKNGKLVQEGIDELVDEGSEKVSKQLTTPNTAARSAVQGEYIDPLTNQKVLTSDLLAADHIFPKKRIEGLPGFSELAAEQKNQVLNYLENFQGLPKTFNSSKGSRLASEWPTWKGQPLDATYRQNLEATQQQIQDELQRMINNFLEE